MVRRVRRDDQGNVSVLAMVLVLVFGMLGAAVAGLGIANARASVVTQAKVQKVTAAAAGVRFAAARLETDPTACAASGSTQTVTQTVNGMTVTIACQPMVGQGTGVQGYAIVTTDTTAANLTDQSGGNKTIQGAVYLSGVPSTTRTKIVDANLYLRVSSPSASCPSMDLTASMAPPYTCVPMTATWKQLGLTVPVLPPSPPAAHGSAPDFITDVAGTTCNIFLPGTYRSAPTLASLNYFASGVYYFENVGAIDMSGKTAVAGTPGATERTVNNQPPCVNDTVVGVNDDSRGAVFILGGTSYIAAGTGSTRQLEIFRRRGTTGLDGFSVVAVTSPAPSGYVTSTLIGNYNDQIIDNSAGNNPALVFHGEIWAPDTSIDSGAVTNGNMFQALGGLVAGRVQLQSSNVGTGLTVMTDPSPSNRAVLVTSTARDSSGGVVVATAVLHVSNVAPFQVAIQTYTVG
jgi:Tfp pilus assembly protein PilX